MRSIPALLSAILLSALYSGCVHGGIRHYDPSQPYPDVFNTDAFKTPTPPPPPGQQKYRHGPVSLNPAVGNEISVAPRFGNWTKPPPVIKSQDPVPPTVVEPAPGDVLKPGTFKPADPGLGVPNP